MNLFISNFKNLLKERIIWLIPTLFVFVFLFHSLSPNTDETRVIENNSFWKKKTFDKNNYQLILCGDSRVYRGLAPQAMNEILPGISITNFAYGSAGFDEVMLKQIDKRIDFDAPKKMVVLGLTPLSITAEGMHNYHMNYELETKREELIELLYFKSFFQFFVPITLDQIRQKIKGNEFKTSFHQEYTYTGWVASYEDKPWPESALKSYSTRFINNQVTEKNIQLVLDQVQKWTSQGVMVFGFRPPTTYKMVALEDSLSGYNELIVKTKFTEAGGKWLEFTIGDYSTYDGSHLQKESAMQLSSDLANKIKLIDSVKP
jgi:hypothetical protein